MQDRNFGKMTTGIERVFRKLPDGLYREIFLHYIHYMDETGVKTGSKLQKQIEGELYRILREDEKGKYKNIHGGVLYTFPEGNTEYLINLGMDYNDLGYGRGVR